MERRVQIIHELAVTEGILKVVLKYAEGNNARRVASIHLQVGELRDFTEEWMQRYFDYLSRGTIAEGGKIIFKRSPVILKCGDCAASFNADLRQGNVLCPECSSEKNTLIAGRELLIESIGVIS